MGEVLGGIMLRTLPSGGQFQDSIREARKQVLAILRLTTRGQKNTKFAAVILGGVGTLYPAPNL